MVVQMYKICEFFFSYSIYDKISRERLENCQYDDSPLFLFLSNSYICTVYLSD